MLLKKGILDMKKYLVFSLMAGIFTIQDSFAYHIKQCDSAGGGIVYCIWCKGNKGFGSRTNPDSWGPDQNSAITQARKSCPGEPYDLFAGPGSGTGEKPAANAIKTKK